MKRKHPDLLLIEEAFTEIKGNRNGKHIQSIATIQRVLKRRFDLDVEISIIDNSGREFFGMSVYPERSSIDVMVDAIVEQRAKADTILELWRKVNKWVIEVDSTLLYDPTLNANPSEITAVLLHEIGHTVYANTIPSRVHRVVAYSLLRVPVSVKKIFTWSKAKRLVGLAFIEACSSPTYWTSSSREEVEADRFAIKQGYGEHLASFMTKLLEGRGNKYFNPTDSELDKEVEIVMDWVVSNTSELEFRKTKLNKSIKDEMIGNPSLFTREYLISIRDDFFGSDGKTRYEELLTEQYVSQELVKYSNVLEGFRDWLDKRGKVKKIAQSDIDIISIEKDRAENEDDRLYVLDLVYDKLDVVNLSLDMLQDSKQAQRVQVSKDTLLRQRDQLNKIRKEVMDMNFPPKQYGLMIKYPPGYEG